MSPKDTLVLFDVDGTLTEPRQPIQKRMLLALHHYTGRWVIIRS